MRIRRFLYLMFATVKTTFAVFGIQQESLEVAEAIKNETSDLTDESPALFTPRRFLSAITNGPNFIFQTNFAGPSLNLPPIAPASPHLPLMALGGQPQGPAMAKLDGQAQIAVALTVDAPPEHLVLLHSEISTQAYGRLAFGHGHFRVEFRPGRNGQKPIMLTIRRPCNRSSHPLPRSAVAHSVMAFAALLPR
jgi:hypothetical protein